MWHRDKAFLSMTSPLGPNLLIPTAFTLKEAIGECFSGTLDIVSQENTIDPERLLHQPVSVTLQPPGAPVRTVHGMVRHFAATGPLPLRNAFSYRAEVVPRLWFLSQTEDCRIFEKKTTKQIIQAVLSDHSVPMAFRVTDTPVRPFTMQYNESDLDFVTRLMQEEGWFFFFTDAAVADTSTGQAGTLPPGSVVISDRVTTLSKAQPFKLIPGPDMLLDRLVKWQPARATTHGWVRHDDYQPERPDQPHGLTRTTRSSNGAVQRGAYHWPAHALDQGAIECRTRNRMEACEADAAMSEGAGFDPGFAPGLRISVSSDGRQALFTLHTVLHQATDGTWCNHPDPPSYSNSFTAYPVELPWRPRQTIPRPRMEGIRSATVLGPEGQEIHTDELGRVKLKFRWDHRGDTKAGQAAWVRVMQPWGGASMGWSFIPRVGTEVAVAFMDGDPDRPVVIGQLHNGRDQPPWSLPQNKTRSGLRTRSTPGGDMQEFSELWFDDRKGEEQVMLHAQRDLTIEAEQDAVHQIGRNRTVTVDKGNDRLTVQRGDRVVDVPLGNHTIKSTSGNIEISTAGGAITLEAMQSITLKVGQSSVTLDQAGVTIKGLMVKMEGQAMTGIKAPLLQLDADGMLKASAGIMLLN